jgi:hypothetical protein
VPLAATGLRLRRYAQGVGETCHLGPAKMRSTNLTHAIRLVACRADGLRFYWGADIRIFLRHATGRLNADRRGSFKQRISRSKAPRHEFCGCKYERCKFERLSVVIGKFVQSELFSDRLFKHRAFGCADEGMRLSGAYFRGEEFTEPTLSVIQVEQITLS